MSAYHALLILKFLGVMTYAGGLVASFVSTSLSERKRAVHRIASPGLGMIWCAGYGLAHLTGVGLMELWVVGGLVLSFVSNAALVQSVARDTRSSVALAASIVPLALVVVLMVLKPTWQMVQR